MAAVAGFIPVGGGREQVALGRSEGEFLWICLHAALILSNEFVSDFLSPLGDRVDYTFLAKAPASCPWTELVPSLGLPGRCLARQRWYLDTVYMYRCHPLLKMNHLLPMNCGQPVSRSPLLWLEMETVLIQITSDRSCH